MPATRSARRKQRDPDVKKPGTTWCRTRLSGWPAIRAAGPEGPLQRAGEGEASLLRCLLGLAAQAAGAGQLVAAPRLLRLSQARGHLCPRQFFCMRFMMVLRFW